MSLLTLGVRDLARSVRFYEQGLGLPRMSSPPEVAFFTLNGTWLGLYGRQAMAEEAGVADDGGGFAGFTIAHNVHSEQEVDQVLAQAEAAGEPMRQLLGAMTLLAFPESAVTDDRRIRLAFRRFLEEGFASGEIRDDVDLDTATEVVVGTWYSVFLSWVHFDHYPLRERASAAARFLARALGAPGAQES